MVVVLMVAEKPSLARSLAEILSHKSCRQRKSFCSACPVYEYDANFPLKGGRSIPAHFKMTSVCGHVMSLDFLPKYNNWEATDPVELFTATTMKKEAMPALHIPSFLCHEGKGVDYLVLWLDCDKEGENICYEVINEVKTTMKPPYRPNEPNILRAKFSSITEPAIMAAFNSLGLPNWNEARSVDARQELDLRVGCAFTRFQTKLFQSSYSGLGHSVVSYGPCQTPTLGFCVQRHDEIQQFKPEKYWKLDCQVRRSLTSLNLTSNRAKFVDHKVAKQFLATLEGIKTARITSVSKKPKTKPPPVALNTVELLRSCSTRLHIGPKQAMDTAERLYTQGFISYPRTETTKYSPGFDFQTVIRDLKTSNDFEEYATYLLSEGIKVPGGGRDVGDHPPITPMKGVARAELRDVDWKVYDLITSHFLASLYPPYKYNHTEVTFAVGKESFHWSGNAPVDPGFTVLQRWQSIDRDCEMSYEFAKDQEWEVVKVGLSDHWTTPPGYLTESELISLMEHHGIGTDASIPVHIENICSRSYVVVDSGRRLVPTRLGIVLVHGYQKIDPELVKPTTRSAIEQELNLIAKGEGDYRVILDRSIDTFRKKFVHFRENIGLMNELFEATFSNKMGVAKPLSRCGKCHRYMSFIPAKPQRLHCKHCDQTYSLPQNGSVKLYKEIKCPLDDFEILLYSGPYGKTFTVCPMCYSIPPTSGRGPITCATCPQSSCPQNKDRLLIDNCSKCENGLLLLDPASGPKWKMCCNNLSCSGVISFFEGAHSVEKTDRECNECESCLVKVNFNKASTPLSGGETIRVGCYQCDDVLSKLVIQGRGSHHYRGRGRGRGRGRRRGRGGRGRGGPQRY